MSNITRELTDIIEGVRVHEAISFPFLTEMLQSRVYDRCARGKIFFLDSDESVG